MARIGITGGGGFIGKALAASLAADGHEVVGFDVVDRAAAHYEALGGRLVVGDITDPSSARSFCAGLDVVIHTAAIVEESGSWQAFERVNVGGTATMVDAAKRAGASTFIHFSSVMVYGFDYADQVTEDGPFDGADNPYCTTKITSEQIVRVAQDPGTFDVFIIRPGDVYGPGSVPWVIRPIKQMRAGKFAYIDPTKSLINHVYVDNLIDGVKLVWQHGTSGEAYCVTDGQRTLARDFFTYYQRFCGVEKVPSIPGRLALAVATILGPRARKLGLDRETVRYIRRHETYSIAKVTALGYQPSVSLEEGMDRCHTWLREEGLVPGPIHVPGS
jgi:nucleoside-diphosphate-sugar epimerase